MNFRYTLIKLGHWQKKEQIKADTGRDALATQHAKELKDAIEILKALDPIKIETELGIIRASKKVDGLEFVGQHKSLMGAIDNLNSAIGRHLSQTSV